jgi:hypothetical protein
VDNQILLGNARDVGISVGTDVTECEGTTDIIKGIDVERLVSFRDNNPNMFLPEKSRH